MLLFQTIHKHQRKPLTPLIYHRKFVCSPVTWRQFFSEVTHFHENFKIWHRQFVCEVLRHVILVRDEKTHPLKLSILMNINKFLEIEKKVEMWKIYDSVKIIVNLWFSNLEFMPAWFSWNKTCSTSFPGGYLVDGLPPAQHSCWEISGRKWVFFENCFGEFHRFWTLYLKCFF